MRTCMLGGGGEWWKGEIIRLFVGLAPILFVSGVFPCAYWCTYTFVSNVVIHVKLRASFHNGFKGQ